MEKSNKFNFKENYRIFIPIALMIVLFAAFLVYYKVSLSNVFHVDTEDSFYQYFYNNKYEYKAIVSKNKKGVIIDFKEEDITINQDSTPIYYSDGKTVIFPSDMSVIMPIMNCSEYLAKGYSYIEYKDKVYKLTTLKYSDNLGHYFLYDGNDLYFFIEEVTLKVSGQEIKLSPMSYVIARYGNYISYYDKENDEYETINVSSDDSLVSNDYYNIYVSKDTVDYYGTNVILTSNIDMLNTIDKKG